ncbi:MAG: Ppx/GppA family phosphatase [Fibrobacter sp.]|nr:Ppx/GppA family phosphatase [Fibrobacter sp.]
MKKKITTNIRENVSISGETKSLAVIDIGSSAIRMNIAQVNSAGEINTLETLQREISLGKDAFSKGMIKKSSTEACVKVLKIFRRKLQEYQITSDQQIRIIATTAVREASNRDSFVDRIFIATGFNIQVIDEVDVARLTYRSVEYYLSSHKIQQNQKFLVTEMSGGTTEILLMKNQDILLSQSYRLGALRLREMLGEFRAPLPRQRELIENDTDRTIDQILGDVKNNPPHTLIAIGGDIRFAASQIQPEWNYSDPIKITLSALSKLTEQIINMSVDEIVHKFHLSYSDAETVGPALLFYFKLGHALKVNHVLVTDISMRSGVLMELAFGGTWTKKFADQIINSALELGRKFNFDEAHARHVEFLSITLFNSLKEEHNLPPSYELHLRIAALLHDIGTFINIRSHHKHSMYIIQNSELFGLSKRDLHLIALIARYHRRSGPKPEHVEFSTLDRDSRLAVLKMASILRVADALDRSNSRRIQQLICTRDDDEFTITIPGVDDITLEQLGIQSKGALFENVYGMRIILRKKAQLLE